MVIRGNHGTLSARRRRGESAQLRDDEVARVEEIVRDSFEGFAAASETGELRTRESTLRSARSVLIAGQGLLDGTGRSPRLGGDDRDSRAEYGDPAVGSLHLRRRAIPRTGMCQHICGALSVGLAKVGLPRETRRPFLGPLTAKAARSRIQIGRNHNSRESGGRDCGLGRIRQTLISG